MLSDVANLSWLIYFVFKYWHIWESETWYIRKLQEIQLGEYKKQAWHLAENWSVVYILFPPWECEGCVLLLLDSLLVVENVSILYPYWS